MFSALFRACRNWFEYPTKILWVLEAEYVSIWNLDKHSVIEAVHQYLQSGNSKWKVRMMTPKEIKEHEYDENA